MFVWSHANTDEGPVGAHIRNQVVKKIGIEIPLLMAGLYL